ncbi:AAA family ATPase [Dickeya zeae]|uniref:AAA family ATPase n=1 Tax=Dickeya zeae TaxID=204042 RepID=UPI001C63550B|nr:AAA family ATPase [Dickeya zeae]
MIIGIFGLSGVGKTKFTNNLKIRCPSVMRFSASELIASFDGVINYDDLKGEVIAENQKKLVVSLKHISEIYRDEVVLIELHNIIETKGGIVFIDKKVLRSLSLDMVFFIKKEPELIKKNRTNDSKKRRIISASEIDKIQRIAISHFLKIYNLTEDSIISGNNDDEKRICKLTNLSH